LNLVLQTAHHIALALHHGIETVIGDLGGVILFGGPDRSIHHLRTAEELRLGGARHQAGDRDLGVLEFLAKRERERVQESLGPL
jgi:hypothetical protein